METSRETCESTSTPSGDRAQPIPSLSLTASERDEILRQHHPEIRNLLDLEQIFPFLNQYRLLTDSEQEELASVIYSRNHKITRLVEWLPRKGSDGLHRFITCLRSSTDGTAHGELANLLQSAAEQAIAARRQHTQGQRSRPLLSQRWVKVLIVIGAIAFALWCYQGGHYRPLATAVLYRLNLYHSPCLPYLPEGFVGRESEMKEVMQLLDFANTKNRLISIIGPPGFGKSTLAIHLGHEMVANRITVYYVDMVEVSSSQALAEKVLDCDAGIVSIKNVTVDRLHKWARGLSHQTLLILDNCDDMLHKEKENLQKVVKKLLESSPNLKILMTSRQRTMLVSHFQSYQLHELTSDASCKLLHNVAEQLNFTVCGMIANLTGNVPLALKVVGALLIQPDPPDPLTVVSNLRKRLISTLSPQELPVDEQVNASISVSYHFLSHRLQKIGRYLANFPGSFDGAAVCRILNSIAKKPIVCEDILELADELTHRSLLEYSRRTGRYYFHRLIREFFLDIQKYTDVGHAESTRFTSRFQWYYSERLGELSQVFQVVYVDALSILDTERHNVQYLFTLIESGHTLPCDQRWVYDSLTNINYAFQRHLLQCRFTPIELYGPVKSIVDYLSQNWEVMLRNFHIPSRIYLKMYVDYVLQLASLEDELNGTSDALFVHKHTIEAIATKIGDKRLKAVSYGRFYSQLAMHYEVIGDYESVKECHEKILHAAEQLRECEPGWCDYLSIANAYNNMRDYKTSTYFYEKALEMQELSAVQRTRVMMNLFTTAKTADKRERIVEELCTFFPSLIAISDSEFYTHNKEIEAMIVFYREHGKMEEADSLEEKLYKVMKEIKRKPSISTAIRMISLAIKLSECGKYTRAVDIAMHAQKTAETFIDELKSQQVSLSSIESVMMMQAYENIILSYLIIGKAKCFAGNTSEGLDYFELAVNLIYEQNLFEKYVGTLSGVCPKLISRWHIKCLVDLAASQMLQLATAVMGAIFGVDVEALLPEPPLVTDHRQITELSSRSIQIYEMKSISVITTTRDYNLLKAITANILLHAKRVLSVTKKIVLDTFSVWVRLCIAYYLVYGASFLYYPQLCAHDYVYLECMLFICGSPLLKLEHCIDHYFPAFIAVYYGS